MEVTIEQALQQGVAAHKEGKLQDAERLYRAILQSQPEHPDANHNMGVLAVSVNKAFDALPFFKTALQANQQEDQFWLSYIDALIKEKQFYEAKKILAKGKKYGVAGLRLNALETQLASMRKIADVSRASPSPEQVSYLLEYYKKRQFGDAERLAISITKKFPKHQLSWKVLGAVLSQTGRKSEAVFAHKTAVALYPQDAEAYSNLGIALKELGRLEEATESYTKAIALKPDFALPHNNLGNALKELGKLEEAEESYTKAIALKPSYAEAYSNLGITLKELGRLYEAKESFTQAIELNPNYAEAYCNLGITLHEMGRLSTAKESYAKAVALKPNYAEAYNNLGITLKTLSKLDEAEESYTKAISLKLDYAEAHNNLANLLQELGRADEAKESYTKAIALKPEYSSAKHMLAALNGETTSTAPQDYVEGLFNNYAPQFEKSLIDNLGYKIPSIISQMIKKDSKADLLGSVIDLGCGTGLFGVEIRQFCKYLEGVDLSRKMLDEAQKKRVYDKLIKQDILAYLSNASLNFDYFVSTDVFVYMGDLSDVFRLIKSRNKKGGKLVFSTEDCGGDSFYLEKSGRYAHSRRYIKSLCKKFDYEFRYVKIQALRKEKKQYIRGGLYLLNF